MKEKEDIYTPNFDKIWERYPNKIGKKSAERHFEATVKTEDDFNKINLAIDNYLVSKRVADGYIQNGSTWFNNWQDWVNTVGLIEANENSNDDLPSRSPGMVYKFWEKDEEWRGGKKTGDKGCLEGYVHEEKIIKVTPGVADNIHGKKKT